jgi:hypothetical protein
MDAKEKYRYSLKPMASSRRKRTKPLANTLAILNADNDATHHVPSFVDWLRSNPFPKVRHTNLSNRPAIAQLIANMVVRATHREDHMQCFREKPNTVYVRCHVSKRWKVMDETELKLLVETARKSLFVDARRWKDELTHPESAHVAPFALHVVRFNAHHLALLRVYKALNHSIMDHPTYAAMCARGTVPLSSSR